MSTIGVRNLQTTSFTHSTVLQDDAFFNFNPRGLVYRRTNALIPKMLYLLNVQSAIRSFL